MINYIMPTSDNQQGASNVTQWYKGKLSRKLVRSVHFEVAVDSFEELRLLRVDNTYYTYVVRKSLFVLSRLLHIERSTKL